MDIGPLRDALTVLLGLATGVLSGLFGVGGGVISQPGMRLLGLAPLVAIGTALPVIIPGALSGALRYRHEDLILWPAVWATIPLGLVAAAGGSEISAQVPGEGHLLQLVTAGLLGFSSYRMATVASPANPDRSASLDATGSPPQGRATNARYAAIGVVGGFLSGLLGIGGGVILVPAFVQVARREVKSAIATSLVCVGAFAIPGTITHALNGQVDWRVAAALIVGVIPGARIGAALTIKAADRRLRLTVATFLGIIALLYAGSELLALR
ncbi:MAG: sulfite exporter TauE/SafE family protein [Acidimicrobiia bacterium]|nr:sulfite exporter TauE/SafE family protein [Acidimicrobiia bacterium]